jgi:DNA-binding MarR family transcriptional regulator
MAAERRRTLAVRAVVAMFREFEQASRDGEMGMAHYRLALFLRNGPRRAGEMAAMMAVTKGTISVQLAAMRERGWIDAESDAADRRASRLVLTDSGRAAMDALEARLGDCLEGLTGGAERPRILAALADLYVALGATRETRFLDLAAARPEPVPRD